MFASLYYGMSLRILEESRALLSKKTLGATFGAIAAADAKVAGIGHIVDGIGDMARRCEISRRMIFQTCNDLIDGYDENRPLTAGAVHRPGQDHRGRQRHAHGDQGDVVGRWVGIPPGHDIRALLPRWRASCTSPSTPTDLHLHRRVHAPARGTQRLMPTRPSWWRQRACGLSSGWRAWSRSPPRRSRSPRRNSISTAITARRR